MLDETKALLARLDYTPYGEPDAWAGALPSMTYTGHYWDPETGMYFAPFRYLMPGQGRWLTRDPAWFIDGLNMYAYVMGMPISAYDEMGLALDSVTATCRKNPRFCYELFKQQGCATSQAAKNVVLSKLRKSARTRLKTIGEHIAKLEKFTRKGSSRGVSDMRKQLRAMIKLLKENNTMVWEVSQMVICKKK